MKKCLLIIGTILLLANTTTYRSDYVIPIRPASITTADIDLDEDLDIVVGHLTNHENTKPAISLLKNDGHGYLSISDTSQAFLGYQHDIICTTINNDDYPDIIANFQVYINDSDTYSYVRVVFVEQNGFGIINDYLVNMADGFTDFTSGDVNGDNHTDIIISSYYDKSWGVFYNDGAGNLVNPEYYNVEFPVIEITSGDLNDDGKDDVVVGGGDVLICISTGNGFEEQVFENGSHDVFIDDFDGDGDKDIVGIDGMYTWNYFAYFENTGTNTFVQHPDTITHPGCFYFFLSDLNNDSLKEILCLNNSLTGIYIFYNLGNFHLSEPIFIPIAYYGESSRRIHAADLDGNGYNDIIVSRGHGAPLQANLTILFNDGSGNFLPDPVGTNLYKTETSKLTCYPNPFHYQTTISFTLMEKTNVKLSIYDMQGNKITCLHDAEVMPGTHKMVWNGTEDDNEKCRSGMYLVKMTYARKTLTQKIILN